MTTLIVKPVNLSKNQSWKASVLIPYIQPLVHWMQDQLPDNILKFMADPANNGDKIKKTLEKSSSPAEDSLKELEQSTEKPLTQLEAEDLGALEKSFENIDPEVEALSAMALKGS